VGWRHEVFSGLGQVEHQEMAKHVVDTLDGDRSTVSLGELDRRIRVALRVEGVTDLVVPQRITRLFLSTLKSEK
jgi:putative transposase